MLGQGRPGPRSVSTTRSEYGWNRILIGLLWLLLWGGNAGTARGANGETDLRLHIAWGGGTARTWQGVFRLNEGVFIDPASLGQEADDVGTIDVNGGVMKVAQRSPSRYMGIDVVVRAPAVAELSMELAPTDRLAAVKRISIPIADLITKPSSSDLDDQKNSLLITRAPGDRIRVEFDRDHLVFSPDERFNLQVRPHHLGIEVGAHVRYKIQLLKAHSEEQVWAEEKDFRTTEDGIEPELAPLSLPVPQVEGVYDLAISLVQRRLTDPLNLVRTKPFATRKVQFVVVEPQPPRPPTVPWKNIGEIDPVQVTNLAGGNESKWTDWLKRTSQLKVFPSFNKGPIGNNKGSKKEHHGFSLVQLERDGWLAYPLPIAKADEPHILEIQYPAGLRQTLGISIVEPNAAGKVVPIGLDSGVDVPETTNEQQLVLHRLVFWPHTKTPLVLIANRGADPAMFGKISVLAGPTALPPLSLPPTLGERDLTAFFDKPLFPENFGALEALAPAAQGTLDDWGTFYHGAKRLVEYLKYSGYNSAVVTVACEGSAIYPSRLLQPIPKYDTGIFFSTGQDPVRKDVLELLFRLFDREGLKLVPAIQFASPLPALEAERRKLGAAAGLDWVNGTGHTWQEVNATRRGLAPYYNTLQPYVRQAMKDVVNELTERYSKHTSFNGVSLQLGPDTFAQLPSDMWGLDDATIAAFEKDSRTKVPGLGPQRFAERAMFLQEEGSAPWLRWRASKMAEFYREIQATVARDNKQAKLYLATADLLIDPHVQLALRPSLPSHASVGDALLRVGLDPKLISNQPSIVLARPNRVATNYALATQAINIEAGISLELDRLFADATHTSVHNYQEVKPLRLSSFDALSPFGAEHTQTMLMTHFASGGIFSRRRFVHALAVSDAHTLLDGGWMLSLGEEDGVRTLVEIFRQLPATKFTEVHSARREPVQPVVVRRAVHRGQTYVYAVNDSRWPALVEVDIENAGTGDVQSLDRANPAAIQRQGEVARWSLRMAPYDLQAIAVSRENSRVSDFRIKLDRGITVELAHQIEEVRNRTNSLRSPKAISGLQNPGFEVSVKNQPLPGWIHATGNGISVVPDSNEFRNGKQSLAIHSTGPETWVRSDPIPVPTSGRLALWVWLKVPNPDAQPPLRLAIEGKVDGRNYYRFATVGAGKGVAPLQGTWSEFRFQVTDLPPQGLSELRIGFDLMGAGDVFVDDVQLFDMWFYNHERDELLKRIAAADFQLEQGAVLDCTRFLDSYWPRLLAQQIPLPPRVAQLPVAPTPAKSSNAPSPPATEPESKSWRFFPKSFKPF